MISTNNIKTKLNDMPQRLVVLTTNKVKPKTEEDMLTSAKAQVAALRPLINTRQTRKYSGAMLTTANMEDRKLNEKRGVLMTKRAAAQKPKVEPQSEPRPEKQRGRPKKS